MRRLLTLAVAAVAVSFVATGAYAGGFVNGGFEDSTDVGDPGLGGWTYFSNGAGVTAQADIWTTKVPPDGPGPHSGTGYAYIHVQDDGTGFPDASIAQAADFTGQVGTRIHVEYWYNINQTLAPPSQYIDIYGYVTNPGVATPPDSGWYKYGNGMASGYRQPIWNEAIEDGFNVSGVWTNRVRTINQLTDPALPFDAVTNPYYHPNYFALVFRPHSYTPGVPQDYSIAVDDAKIYLIPPGDANQDGQVSVGDLGILAANYGTTTGGTWATGDFNYDGAVSVGDLGILAANYGVNNLAAAAAVPEPATLSLLGLGVLALRRRR